MREGMYDLEEFDLSLKAYVSYVNRKLKKDEDYEPHPLIKALVNAIEAAKSVDKPGQYAGVSSDSSQTNENTPKQTFGCVVELNKDKTYTILDFHDFNINKPVPIKVASYIILLSMHFDKYEDGEIDVDNAVSIINDSIPEINFIRFNNAEWKEARDHLKYVIEVENSFHVPSNYYEDFKKDLMSITKETDWEDYPRQLRTSIAIIYYQEKYPELMKDDCINTVNVFLDDKYPKGKIIDVVLNMLYGVPSEYFKDITQWTTFFDISFNSNTKHTNTIKVGRNDPCPCGSGKKYKKCCLK